MAVIRNSEVATLQGFCYCGSQNPDQSYLTTIIEDGRCSGVAIHCIGLGLAVALGGPVQYSPSPVH